ncbi:hypothetical protein C5749_05770 [Sphingobacterium gobiense]|uniref:Uncharacterized protein n=1 Tax=Sphingobacterium gobiense TaxID=1382456 RepID=A0A2S9JTW2_9SPHI|nr:hypothetical protein C5749_05770 [Sphingobacterium gobiense]
MIGTAIINEQITHGFAVKNSIISFFCSSCTAVNPKVRYHLNNLGMRHKIYFDQTQVALIRIKVESKTLKCKWDFENICQILNHHLLDIFLYSFYISSSHIIFVKSYFRFFSICQPLKLILMGMSLVNEKIATSRAYCITVENQIRKYISSVLINQK